MKNEKRSKKILRMKKKEVTYDIQIEGNGRNSLKPWD